MNHVHGNNVAVFVDCSRIISNSDISFNCSSFSQFSSWESGMFVFSWSNESVFSWSISSELFFSSLSSCSVSLFSSKFSGKSATSSHISRFFEISKLFGSSVFSEIIVFSENSVSNNSEVWE